MLNSHGELIANVALSRLFFFFQAEDGIRDIGVTGVQTCALPISSVIAEGRFVTYDLKPRPDDPTAVGTSQVADAVIARDRKSGRVGKECRSRWSPYH